MLTCNFQDSLDILDLAGIRCNPSPAIHAATDRWSRYNYNALSIRFRHLPCAVHSKLDLQVLLWGILPRNPCSCWYHPDRPLFGFFLHILQQVSYRCTWTIETPPKLSLSGLCWCGILILEQGAEGQEICSSRMNGSMSLCREAFNMPLFVSGLKFFIHYTTTILARKWGFFISICHSMQQMGNEGIADPSY